MADEQPPDWITTELRRAAVTERAPAHLRLQLDAMSRRTLRPHPRRRRRVLLPAAGLLVALGLALALILPGGTPGGPTVAQAAELGARAVRPFPATLAPVASEHQAYFALAPGVHFPQWRTNGGWTFAGASVNTLEGRKVLTLDYAHAGHVVAYSIAATPVLGGQKSGFTSFHLGRRTVVSWEEKNHSCLLSATSVSPRTLFRLARSSTR